MDEPRPGTPVYLTRAEAVARVAESESTVKRCLRENRFPNAYKDPSDGSWRIPVNDLIGAGLTLAKPSKNQGPDTPQNQPQPDADPFMRLPASEIIDLRVRAATAQSEADALRREIATKDRALQLVEATLMRALEAPPATEQPTVHTPTEPIPEPASAVPMTFTAWRKARKQAKAAARRDSTA